MYKSVVKLSKNAFSSLEPIEIRIAESKTTTNIGLFVAPLTSSDKPIEWTLLAVVPTGTGFTYTKKIDTGLYALGTDETGDIRTCAIFRITDSPSGFFQTLSLLSTAGWISCLCILKSFVFRKSRR